MKKIDVILISFLLLIIIVGVLSIRVINSTGAQCIASPIEYGVKEFSEQLGSSMVCTCSAQGITPTIVTENGTTPVRTEIPDLEMQFNFSDIEKAFTAS